MTLHDVLAGFSRFAAVVVPPHIEHSLSSLSCFERALIKFAYCSSLIANSVIGAPGGALSFGALAKVPLLIRPHS